MPTQSNSTVTIEVHPPQTVHKSSTIASAVKAKLQFDSDSYLKGDEDNIFATAVVKDTNGNPIANGDYGGNMETRYQSKQTVGNKVNLTYTFPDLAIHKTGSFRIHISICYMDRGTGTVVLGHAESWILMVH